MNLPPGAVTSFLIDSHFDTKKVNLVNHFIFQFVPPSPKILGSRVRARVLGSNRILLGVRVRVRVMGLG